MAMKPGQVLVLGAQAVGQPRPDARPDQPGLAAVHQQQRRLVVRHVGVHRADDADVVDVLGGVREQLADLEPALAVLLELERRGERGPGLALGAAGSASAAACRRTWSSSGLGSNVSTWVGPPLAKMWMTRLALAGKCGFFGRERVERPARRPGGRPGRGARRGRARRSRGRSGAGGRGGTICRDGSRQSMPGLHLKEPRRGARKAGQHIFAIDELVTQSFRPDRAGGRPSHSLFRVNDPNHADSGFKYSVAFSEACQACWTANDLNAQVRGDSRTPDDRCRFRSRSNSKTRHPDRVPCRVAFGLTPVSAKSAQGDSR